jgi:hypothetical protein
VEVTTRRQFLGTNLLGGTMALASQRRPVEAEVKPHLGKPALFINGRPTYASFFALTDAPGGRWSFEEMPGMAIGDFTRAGFRLFQVDLFLELVWTKPGPLDIGLARRQLRGVLDRCPDAGIVLRWHVNAPEWWTRQHPAEWTRYANGDMETIEHTQPVRILMDDLRRVPRISLASEKWVEMATEKTRELLRGLAASPEGGALAGIQPACGVYGEWHYWGFMRNEPDSSAPMQAYFDAWRARRGKGAVPIPGVEERRALDDGIFREPAKREVVIDYYRAQQELVAERIIHFCSVAKKAWPRKLLTGTFYGYFFSMFNRSATGGHLCLDKVLASPAVDYLSAPQAYGDSYRGLGASGISRALVDSVRLNNKLFLDEMDQTPSWVWQNNVDVAFRLSDLEADVAIIRRNVLTSYTRGAGLWYYDFGPANQAGWWSDTRLMAEIGRLKQVLERYHARPYQPAADVLFVFDTEVFYYTGSVANSDPVTDPQAVNQTIIAAWASGAAVETIHLSDLARIDLSRFKVVVMANTWLLSAEQRRLLRERVAGDGRHVVFQVAPGYCDGQKLDVSFVEEVTGLRMTRVTEGTPFAPRFEVAGAGAGVVRRERTWFASTPITAPGEWRKIFRAAGAHIYVDSGDVIHAGGGVVLLHSKDGGARKLQFRSGKVATFDLPAKASWLFDAETGERLL